MKRSEIADAYTIDPHGMITSPGKFEGEAIYAPHFYECASDGEELSFMEDGCGEYVSLIEIDDDDRREFPELNRDAKYALVTENDQGFVSVSLLYTEEAADDTRDNYASDDDDDADTDDDDDDA